MHFNKNVAGAAVIMVAVCALVAPSAAWASTADYTTTKSSGKTTSSQPSSSSIATVITLGSSDDTTNDGVIDLSDATDLTYVEVKEGQADGDVSIKLSDEFSGIIKLHGSEDYEFTVRCGSNKVGTSDDSDTYIAVGGGTECGDLTDDGESFEAADSDIASEIQDFLTGAGESLISVVIDNDYVETLDFSENTEMEDLDVSGSRKLTSIDLDDAENLENLNIEDTKLTVVDGSDCNISAVDTSRTYSGEGFYAGSEQTIEIDSQKPDISVNGNDDDLNDYMFDLGDISAASGSFIEGSDGAFTVIGADGSALDTTDGDVFTYTSDLVIITAAEAPQSVTYTTYFDKSDSADFDEDMASDVLAYKVKFVVQDTQGRLSGSNRFDTMVAINSNYGYDELDDVFDDCGGNIVVASGVNYADALSASALAGALDTGMVLSSFDSLTSDTVSLLEGMTDPGTATVVGGYAAVPEGVSEQLSDLGFSIDRIYGDNRFETAVAVEERIQDMLDDSEIPDSQTAIIASGVNFADALAIAPYAYTQNIPILLVGSNGKMDDDSAELFNKYKDEYENAIIVGGTSAVSESVYTTLTGYDMNVIRLAGSNRFETNLVINEWLDTGDEAVDDDDEIFDDAGYDSDEMDAFIDAELYAASGSSANNFGGTAYVTTGVGFADALAVAPLAGIEGGTICMVYEDDYSTIKEALDNDAEYVLVGGTSSISEDLEEKIEKLAD